MAHRRDLVEPEIAKHRGRASPRSPLTVSGPRLVGSVTFPFTKTEITLLAIGYRGWKPAFAAEYRPIRARIATRLAGPALAPSGGPVTRRGYHCRGQPGSAQGKPALLDRQNPNHHLQCCTRPRDPSSAKARRQSTAKPETGFFRIEKVGFAMDTPLERRRFELAVPPRSRARLAGRAGRFPAGRARPTLAMDVECAPHLSLS